MTKEKIQTSSRRNLLAGSAALVAGGVLGGVVSANVTEPEQPGAKPHRSHVLLERPAPWF